jgi:phosphoglycolate phosphatase
LTVRGLLFDLDGTLVDTAPDLVAVLNTLLAEADRPPMPYAVARNEVSNGALGLIRFGFGAALTDEQTESLRTRFLEIYTTDICNNSRVFFDIGALLHGNYQDNCWGIVTNKPQGFTMPLLEALGIAPPSGCIVSGDTLKERKPHPAPLLLAARRLGLDPRDCVYVGDAPRDIEAGHAAGMTTVAALWGYIRPAEEPLAWSAHALVRHPRELGRALEGLGATKS